MLCKVLARKVGERQGLTKVDLLHIVTNYACMMRTLPGRPKEEWIGAGKAVLEHHFDCHSFCGKFCKRKTVTAEERGRCTKIHQSKTKDAKLCALLEGTLSRFITESALQEVGHGGDTLVNESLNNAFSWHAPKNKTFAGSCSLTNRICIGLAVHSIGAVEHCRHLFGEFGLTMTKNIRRYFQLQEKCRSCRKQKCKRTSVKKERNGLLLHEKLKQHTEVPRKQIAKREGAVYSPGIGFAAGTCAPIQPKKNLKPCVACGQVGAGHVRPWSEKCPKHDEHLANKEKARVSALPDDNNAADDQVKMDANEQDPLDVIGFDTKVDDPLAAEAAQDDDDSDSEESDMV